MIGRADPAGLHIDPGAVGQGRAQRRERADAALTALIGSAEVEDVLQGHARQHTLK